MTDVEIVAGIGEKARAIFNAPTLVYEPGLVFRDILGFDSVQAIQFILSIEAAFGVMLDEEEVDRMFTMGDLFEVLRSKAPASPIGRDEK